MRAVCWMGRKDVTVENVPDPKILNPRDAIVRVTATAICGSDLHLYNAFIPSMMRGDILGHEFMGEVVEVGRDVKNLNIGDRVLVPFCIACGNCFHCKREQYSACENSNPNAWMAEKMYGYTTAGLFGYSHMTGGYAGGQAEFARVPFADFGLLKIENDLPDEKLLFLTDIFPTGYMAAENCNIQPGDVVAVWGCGPVGQFAIRSAFLLGAERVIAIDRFPERLRLAEEAGATLIDYTEVESVLEVLRTLTGGRGPDACIDAVGMEAHGTGLMAMYDEVKQAMRLEADRAIVLREAIQACRTGGTLSIPGVYGGLIDKVPFGAIMQKGLTIKTGQTHMQRYMRPLLERVEKGEIDLSTIISHKLPLDDAPHGYQIFCDKQEDCTKIVLDPGAQRAA
jgi:threonine dehydrogenase-like Zn-dependent dehydrogenase